MSTKPSLGTVLIADDEHVHVRLIERWLTQRGYQVLMASDGREALSLIHRSIPDVVCLDINMPRMNGLEALERLKNLVPQVPVIMLTADDQLESVVQAMQLGAYDYLHKPCDLQKLLATLTHAIDKHRMAQRIVELERASGQRQYEEILSRSTRMDVVFRQLDKLVHSDISVLIRGESGTGKELIANAIHSYSGRAKGPFIAVNCGAIPESLQESEFFGHEKGAFTGANARSAGKLEQANGGTLFLDEIAEMPLNLQAALLRALQEHRFTRVGGQAEVQTDFRLVAASHKELLAEVKAGRFREDLYYRVAVFELDLPALRERPEDIPFLAKHFIEHFANEDKRRALPLSEAASHALQSYEWPGNVRELRNAMRRAVVIAEEVIDVGDLPRALHEPSQRPTAPRKDTSPHPTSPARSSDATATPAPAQHLEPAAHGLLPLVTIAELERLAIIQALSHTGNNASESARLLGISRATFYRKLKLYEIEPDAS